MSRYALRWGMYLLAAMSIISAALAQTFTYQGFLRQNGIPADGIYRMIFRLYDAPMGGNLLAVYPILGTLSVRVRDGLFTVPIDFPSSVWTGADRYLEIQIDSTTLSPRVKVNPTPYSFYAYRAPWSGIVGIPTASGDVSGTYPSLTVVGLQGRPVSNTTPANGQVLKWNGSQWEPANDLTDQIWMRSGSNIFYNAGNVGIGTSSPGAPLQVNTSYLDPYTHFGNAIIAIHSATSGYGIALYGRSDSTEGSGVVGYATATTGINHGVEGYSSSPSGIGVAGFVSANSGVPYGVYGSAASAGYGVYSFGRFAASGTKSFQIDHPLHPETHFLNHFCTEGPEPYNVYSGIVVLDERGEAWVQLPDYFEAINRDPRYTLTPIGAPMPNLHIAQEIRGNRFKIAGGVPGGKVSWRVEAIRNDRWVQRYGYQTEQEKPKEYQGKYLHPELYGQPKERGIFYRPEPAPPESAPVRPNEK